MIKDNLNYKLVNAALVVLIIYLMYHTGFLWIGIFAIACKIIFPFFIAFVVAYALYPFEKWLMDHKIPKSLSVFIIIAVIFIVFGSVLATVLPLLIDQLVSLFNSIMAFIGKASMRFDIDIHSLEKVLNSGFNDILGVVSKHVSNGAIKVINVSLGYISTAFIIFASFVYFLLEMDNIRAGIKKFLKNKSERSYHYVKILDGEMKNYLSGLIAVMFITLFEYSIAYKLIGHPNAMLLGLLAMLGCLIPYFGGMATNCVAAITAFVVSPALFIRTCITFIILSGVDGYVINPFVYGKTNNVHPLIVIFSVFAGGILFGVFGIMISFPMAAIAIATYKFFKEDINDKINDMKKSK